MPCGLCQSGEKTELCPISCQVPHLPHLLLPPPLKMRTRSSYSGESARINERQRRHFNGRFDNIVDAMYRYIKEYRREEDRAIIAVVSNDEKKMQLESRSKKRWWKVRWGELSPSRTLCVDGRGSALFMNRLIMKMTCGG